MRCFIFVVLCSDWYYVWLVMGLVFLCIISMGIGSEWSWSFSG